MPERTNMENKYQEALSDMIDNGVTCEWFNEKAFLPQEENPCFMLQELVDKETPMKPKYNDYDEAYRCSHEKCNGLLWKPRVSIEAITYCPHCGQAIDWENN